MAQNKPGDFWVEIDYITVGGGPHTMQKPTGDWIGVPLQEPGAFLAWDGSDIAAPTMIEALVDLCLPLVTMATTFSGWTVFRQLSTDDRPVIMAQGLLTGKIGEAPTTNPFLAWQKTYTFRTADNGIGKHVLLDTPVGGTASRTTVVTGDELLLVNALKSPANSWAGRDNSQLAIFRSLSNAQNDRLVREYRL